MNRRSDPDLTGIEGVMKFDHFEKFTAEDAQAYLNQFLSFGENEAQRILESGLRARVDLDFTITSVPRLFKSLLPGLATVPREPDHNVPKFISDTEEYRRCLFDFDDTSKLVVLAAAFYFGESFVRSFSMLSWQVGHPEYVVRRMPVVSGFKFDVEMAPIMISENILIGVIAGLRGADSVDTVIETWSTKYL